MSQAHEQQVRDRAEAAEARRFDALIEDAYAVPPTDEILAAAVERGPPRHGAFWVAAILVLGLSVAFVVAYWSERGQDRGADHATRPDGPEAMDPTISQDPGPQDPGPEHAGPEDAARGSGQGEPERKPEPIVVESAFALRRTVPDTAVSLELRFLPTEVESLERFQELRELSFVLTGDKLTEHLLSDDDTGGFEGFEQLGVLRSSPKLRGLRLQGIPLLPFDLRTLAALVELEHFELVGPIQPGSAMGSPQRLDGNWTASLARDCSARSLVLADMIAEPGCLDGLNHERLEHLEVRNLRGLRPQDLGCLGRMESLRSIAFGQMHARSLDGLVTGPRGVMGDQSLDASVFEALGTLPGLESVVFTQCYLDDAIVGALPRGLRRLDLRTCSGVDVGLPVAVADMPGLTDIGLPLELAGAAVFPEPPLVDGKARRLGDAAAREVLGLKAWETVRLHGPIPEGVGAALSSPSIRHLVVHTPVGGVDLSFVVQMPGLRRFTWKLSQVWAELLEPLNRSRSLEQVDLSACQVSMKPNNFRDWRDVLDERIELIR